MENQKKYKVHQPRPSLSLEEIKAWNAKQTLLTQSVFGGQKNLSDFTYIYDFWSEPPLNQGATSSCVEHSHMGALSKMLQNCMNYYSVVALVARLGTWGKSVENSEVVLRGSSVKTYEFLIDGKSVIPVQTYQKDVAPQILIPLFDSIIYDKFYSGLNRDFVFSLTDKVYSDSAELITDRLNISHNQYSSAYNNANTLISDIKNCIDQYGVAVVSIDFDTSLASEGCLSSIWMHNETAANYWCLDLSSEQVLIDYFKNNGSSWHDVIFFGYSDTTDGDGIFAIKNSWGNTAGENGNYFMQYKYLSDLAQYTTSCVDVTYFQPKSAVPIQNQNDYIFYNKLDPNVTMIEFCMFNVTSLYMDVSNGTKFGIGQALWQFLGTITQGGPAIFLLREYVGVYGSYKPVSCTEFEIVLSDSRVTVSILGSAQNHCLSICNFGKEITV